MESENAVSKDSKNVMCADNLSLVICAIDNAGIRNEITSSSGMVLEFSNGCWLDLNERDGLFWGTNPYGLDWACNADAEAGGAILRWLSFWNESRDEAGQRLSMSNTHKY